MTFSSLREKGNGVDVSVPLPCVSGVHCQLEMERNKLYVTDLGSTNGTYVDGFQLRKNNRFRIFNQSVVRLGAENRDGEDYASFGTDLTGADEMEKNSEYGQLNYFIEFFGRSEGGHQLHLHQLGFPRYFLHSFKVLII